MGGTADGGQTMGQDAPEDLVTVREAASAVGVTAPAVHAWIKRGRLTAYAPLPPQGRPVSLAAVRALCVAPDPQAPAEARQVYEVAPIVGLARWRIASWIRRGLLPSWRGPHGLLVCESDVRAVAHRQGLLPPDAEAGE